MELIGPKYIGTRISIKALRDFILDNDIAENDTIALNTKNFDDLVLDYRRENNVGITVPYYLLGVLIDEDISNAVPVDRIMVIRGYEREERNTMRVIDMESTSSEKDEIFYRCGWCGNVVAANGAELSYAEMQRRINIHEKYETETKSVNGYCCPNGNSKH